MQLAQKIAPCLWFDDQAEQAAELYTSVFQNSKITKVTRYSEVGQEIHGKEPGSVMTVGFELNGQPFTALNGGPVFQFSEALSFQVFCDTQDEVDYYWNRLGAGGDQQAQQCGWLKDRYGVSWQVIPNAFIEMMNSSDAAAAQRATAAMLQMKKLDITELRRAYEG